MDKRARIKISIILLIVSIILISIIFIDLISGSDEQPIKTFNNSLTSETLNFTGNQNFTRYLRVRKDELVRSAHFNLTGTDVINGSKIFAVLPNETKCEGDFNVAHPCTHAYDDNYATYSQRVDTYGDSWVYLNYSYKDNHVITKWEGTGGACFYTVAFYFYCWDYTNEVWTIAGVLQDESPGGPSSVYASNNSFGNCINENKSLQIKVRHESSVGFGDCAPISYAIFYDGNITLNETESPLIPYVEIGAVNGIDHEWNYSDYDGHYNITNRTDNLASAINDAVNDGACDCANSVGGDCVLDGDYCDVPFIFHSDGYGNLTIDEIDVKYNYGCSNGTYNYSCGDTVITSCTMNQNLDCEEDGFIIGADNVVIDGDSYTLNIVDATYVPTPVGNVSGISNFKGYDNITVKNLNFDFSDSIEIKGYGIAHSNSVNNTILNNSITMEVFGRENYGIFLYNSSYSNISNNSITINDNGYGMYLKRNSSNNTISGNDITTSDSSPGGTTYGVYMEDGSSSNNISDDYISASGNQYSYGYYILGSSNFIKDSEITSGTYDFYLSGTTITNLTNCSFSKTKVGLGENDPILNVNWYVDVAVNYSNNSAVPGADALAYDVDNILHNNGTVDNNGLIPRQDVLEYKVETGGITYYTNYTFKATNGSLWSDNINRNITTNFLDGDKIQLTIDLTGVIQLVNPPSWNVNMYNDETEDLTYTAENIGQGDATACWINVTGDLQTYVFPNISNFDITVGEQKNFYINITRPINGNYESVLNVSCTTAGISTSITNYPDLDIQVTSRPAQPGGGGGGGPGIICPGREWDALSYQGKAALQTYILPEGQRSLSLFLVNKGDEEVTIRFKCYDTNQSEGICNYISLSESELVLPTQSQVEKRLDITVDLRSQDLFKEGTHYFSIEMQDNQQCYLYYPVTLLISRWGKFFDPISFLTSNIIIEREPEDILLPYWAILMLSYFIIVPIFWWIFRRAKFSSPIIYSLILGGFIVLIMFILL